MAADLHESFVTTVRNCLLIASSCEFRSDNVDL